VKDISEEQKLENVQKVYSLVENFPEPRRSKVKEMLDGPIGQFYFTAPASSKYEFHSAYPGGLVQHSLNVIKNLWRLVNDLDPDRWPKHKLAFVGLFHDFGKVGDGEVERYIPNPAKNQLFFRPYVINPKMQYLSTSDGALYLLQKHGVELDFEEFQAIKLNDGQYDPANAGYKMRECSLALLLHMADVYATKAEKIIES
jgi:hypothetical protein